MKRYVVLMACFALTVLLSQIIKLSPSLQQQQQTKQTTLRIPNKDVTTIPQVNVGEEDNTAAPQPPLQTEGDSAAAAAGSDDLFRPYAPHFQCLPLYSKQGRWVSNRTGGWIPSPSQQQQPPECPKYRNFSQHDALKCLQGKKILLIGNSNTRAMYTAMEAVLKAAPVLGRLAAKQMCDNSKRNHSCGQMVDIPPYKPIEMFYWGYIQDLHHAELDVKTAHQKHFDLVIMNTGANVIQALPEERWSRDHKANLPKLIRFAKSFPQATFLWHTTTRICEAQPHFRRYKYKPQYWRHRQLHEMNAEIMRSNGFVEKALLGLGDKTIGVLDGAGMVT
eukprot:PhF_6_TR15097/c0_g1_i1/m.23757